MRTSSFIAIALVLSGCAGVPNYGKAEKLFLQSRKDAKLLSISKRDPNRYETEIAFIFTLPTDTVEHEEVWKYHQVAEGRILGEKKQVR